jgi:hypothetical protein
MNKEVLSNLVLENKKQIEILKRIEMTKKKLDELFDEYNNSFKIQINYLDIIKCGYFKNKKKLNLKI